MRVKRREVEFSGDEEQHDAHGVDRRSPRASRLPAWQRPEAASRKSLVVRRQWPGHGDGWSWSQPSSIRPRCRRTREVSLMVSLVTSERSLCSQAASTCRGQIARTRRPFSSAASGPGTDPPRLGPTPARLDQPALFRGFHSFRRPTATAAAPGAWKPRLHRRLTSPLQPSAY